MRMDRVARESEGRTLLRKIWLGLLLRTGLLVLTTWLMFTYVFGISIASSDDMYPAIHEGDLVVLYRLGSYSREDVVEYTVAGEQYLGRIVGTEGTQLGITEDGRLTLDGRFLPVQPRQGIYEETMTEDGDPEEAVVPSGSFYILGDSRGDATDSRKLGAVSKSQMKGKVFMVWRRRGI